MSDKVHPPAPLVSSVPPWVRTLSRRRFLRIAGGGAGAMTLIALPGCGYFPAESCPGAYEAWTFPGAEQRPEYLAAGAAILAANPHNSQPWRFVVSAERIELHADVGKSLGAMDGYHREMYLGLGCALENLVLAAAQHGRHPDVTLLPASEDECHAATVELREATPEAIALYPFIAQRRTNRGAYLDEAPPSGLEAALRGLVSESEVQLTFLGDAAQKRRFREGTIEATRAIVADTEMNEASHAWWRQTCTDIEAHRDGLTLDTTGQGSSTRFLGKVTSAPDAEAAGQYWLELTEQTHTTGAVYVILSTSDRYSRREQLECGRAFQRVALWAASQGMAIQPLNQMAERQDRESLLELEPARFTDLLRELTDASEAGAQLLFRIGYPWDDAFKSPRRPLSWVLL